MITPIDKFNENILQLLQQVSDVDEKKCRLKVDTNLGNLDSLLAKNKSQDLEVYFSLDDNAIGAIKYKSTPIVVRKKTPEGLVLLTIPPYLELSDISVSPEHQGKKLSKTVYNFLLEKIETEKLYEISNTLLIGGVGLLKEFYDNLYNSTNYSKQSTFIPRELFGEHWDLLEEVRKETQGTKIYCERLGLSLVGSSKTHGGPIYTGPDLESIAKKRV